MPRASDARDRFIETAVRLFRRQGYNGVGLSQIIAESGAPKGSFYHHFPGGKEELGAAAIAAAQAMIARQIDRAFEGRPDFDAGAAELARAAGRMIAASDWREGCPVATIAIDAGGGSERLRADAAAALGAWMAQIAQHGERLGLDPSIARARAEALLIALEGAWVFARLRGTTEPFDRIAEAAAALGAKGVAA